MPGDQHWLLPVTQPKHQLDHSHEVSLQSLRALHVSFKRSVPRATHVEVVIDTQLQKSCSVTSTTFYSLESSHYREGNQTPCHGRNIKKFEDTFKNHCIILDSFSQNMVWKILFQTFHEIVLVRVQSTMILIIHISVILTVITKWV